MSITDEFYGTIDSNFMKNSLCKDCIHKVSREIKPLETTLELWEQALGFELEADTILETNTCLLLQIDLDHTVLKCSSYTSVDSKKFMDNLSNLKNK